jgi:hypothetical protein
LSLSQIRRWIARRVVEIDARQNDDRRNLDLIRTIVLHGGRKYTAGIIDRTKYKRLVDLGWLTRFNVNSSDVEYVPPIWAAQQQSPAVEAETDSWSMKMDSELIELAPRMLALAHQLAPRHDVALSKEWPTT